MRTIRFVSLAAVVLAACAVAPTPAVADPAPPIQAAAGEQLPLDSIRAAFTGTLSERIERYREQRAIDSLIREQKIVRGMRQSRERAVVILTSFSRDGTVDASPALQVNAAIASASHRTLNPIVYLGAIAGATYGAARYDHDAGGWDRSQFRLTKDLYHTGGGALLELASERATRSPLLSVVGSGAACYGFERWQGYPSNQDAIACGVGVASAFVFSRIFR